MRETIMEREQVEQQDARALLHREATDEASSNAHEWDNVIYIRAAVHAKRWSHCHQH
jgi:hypothetical protein